MLWRAGLFLAIDPAPDRAELTASLILLLFDTSLDAVPFFSERLPSAHGVTKKDRHAFADEVAEGLPVQVM